MFFRKAIKYKFRSYDNSVVVLLSVFLFFILADIAGAQKRIHSVFFEGTDFELHVYRIFGKEPGKTLLLIGGIQGDEPGGFLSADHYADINLAQGNIIVVPRANFQSIVLKRRQINEDMNRKFAEDRKTNYETKIVSILKKLIAESDCLLNLHDGSGFFAHEWEGPDRNPKRYGQSIITDCEVHINQETGQRLELGAMAKSVAEQINKKIKNPQHHFHFNNHKTDKKTSLHKEQRKSATYYALKTCNIPAFGIETSKLLPLEKKVRHHNLAINAFMRKLDIVQETPGVNIDDPVLNYLVVSINDSLPIAVKNKQTLHINRGDTVEISHIEANYDRGLSADIIGAGAINDIKKKIRITGPTRIIVRKDYYPCGNIYIAIDEGEKNEKNNFAVSDGLPGNPLLLFFKIKINQEELILENYGHVKLIKGDTFEIMDVISNHPDPFELTVNVKGYVGDPQNNTGEDRGYAINTCKDLWERYSLNKEGKRYQAVVKDKKTTIGKLFIDLENPTLKYLVLQMENNQKHCFVPGDTAVVKANRQFKLIDINTNIKRNNGVKIFIAGPKSFRRPVHLKEALVMGDWPNLTSNKTGAYRIDIKRDTIILGTVFLNYVQ